MQLTWDSNRVSRIVGTPFLVIICLDINDVLISIVSSYINYFLFFPFLGFFSQVTMKEIKAAVRDSCEGALMKCC